MKEIIQQLNINDRRTITQLLNLFQKVDRKTEKFKKTTGIRCPDMCGVCCMKPGIETTAIEMLPLAVDLWSRNEADMWLEKINKAEHKGLCVFFKPEIGTLNNGQCGVYSLRPLICRLFGFFTVRDKYGNYVYGSCKIIKEKYQASYQRASKMIEENHPSNMTDFAIRIISLGSDLSRKMLPINLAARIGIEKIGFDLEKNKKAQGIYT